MSGKKRSRGQSESSMRHLLRRRALLSLVWHVLRSNTLCSILMYNDLSSRRVIFIRRSESPWDSASTVDLECGNAFSINVQRTSKLYPSLCQTFADVAISPTQVARRHNSILLAYTYIRSSVNINAMQGISIYPKP